MYLKVFRPASQAKRRWAPDSVKPTLSRPEEAAREIGGGGPVATQTCVVAAGDISFPDTLMVLVEATDCRLLENYFSQASLALWPLAGEEDEGQAGFGVCPGPLPACGRLPGRGG